MGNVDWHSIVSSGDLNMITVNFVGKLGKLYCECYSLRVKYVGGKH